MKGKWRFPRQVSEETSTVLLDNRKQKLSSSLLTDLTVIEDDGDQTVCVH